jgi:hypothetical protein
MHIRACLLRHQDGALGRCTSAATAYSWEITINPAIRESEILQAFSTALRRAPRCQAKIAQQT